MENINIKYKIQGNTKQFYIKISHDTRYFEINLMSVRLIFYFKIFVNTIFY